MTASAAADHIGADRIRHARQLAGCKQPSPLRDREPAAPAGRSPPDPTTARAAEPSVVRTLAHLAIAAEPADRLAAARSNRRCLAVCQSWLSPGLLAPWCRACARRRPPVGCHRPYSHKPLTGAERPPQTPSSLAELCVTSRVTAWAGPARGWRTRCRSFPASGQLAATPGRGLLSASGGRHRSGRSRPRSPAACTWSR